MRLTKLKPAVEKIASDAWEDFQIAGETVERVDRVLDVRQGKLCWVIGTIYMEMPLKPNILDDISKDVSISCTWTYLAVLIGPALDLSPPSTPKIPITLRRRSHNAGRRVRAATIDWISNVK